jgi:hypothetical protein
MPTVIRNFNAGALRRLDAVQALFLADGDFDSVNDSMFKVQCCLGSSHNFEP